MGVLGAVKGTLNAAGLGIIGDILFGDLDRFVKGFVFEVYDQREPGKALITKSLVLNPRRYTITEPFAVTLTPTEDDKVVAEENGIIIREIVIEGTTGISDKKEEALGRGGQIGTQASGVEHFYQLRDMFRKYSDWKKDPDMAPYVQMIFHNVKEDDHYLVVPRAFETPRDAATNRMHFNYRITLAAIQKLPPPRPATDEFDFFGLKDDIEDITEAIQDGRAYFVETINEIEILRHRIRNPEEFLESAAICLNSAYELTIGVIESIETGEVFWDTTIDLMEDLQAVVDSDMGEPELQPMNEYEKTRGLPKLRAALGKIQSQPRVFSRPLGRDTSKPYSGEKNLTNEDLRTGGAGANVGSRTRIARGSEAKAGLDLGAFAGSEEAEISGVDTIDTLAAQHQVPREAIIELNNLIFPYITSTGAPGTLRPGDPILIPKRSTGRTEGTYPSDDYLTSADILYGVDMALDAELAEQGVFDIAINELHGATDASLVRGVNNVIQGMQIIVGTELGSTTFIRDLGIKRLPGTKGTVELMLTASINLRDAVLSDTRVETIDSIRLVLEGDRLDQEITPVLINKRDGVTLVVPFGTVATG
jgi:hypothetical protein